MPDIIQCPQCERKLKVPDTLRGKVVKCPTCGVAFSADAERTGPPDVAASDDLPARVPETASSREPSAEEKAPIRRRRRVAAVDDEEDYDEQLAEREEEERTGDFGGVSAWARVRTGVT